VDNFDVFALVMLLAAPIAGLVSALFFDRKTKVI
jgi:hypothetical protein